MTSIKIYLDPDDTIEKAQADIITALSSHDDTHEKYDDVLAEQLLAEATKATKELVQKMYQEIGDVITNDVYETTI